MIPSLETLKPFERIQVTDDFLSKQREISVENNDKSTDGANKQLGRLKKNKCHFIDKIKNLIDS